MAELGSRKRREADPLRRFLDYLVEIEQALMRRDALRVTALLRKRTATHLPREVREELLMVSRASRESLRAPVQFLRFQHRMTQLAAGGEKLPTAQTELRFERFERASAGTIRRGERRAAARDAARDSARDARDARLDSAGDDGDVKE